MANQPYRPTLDPRLFAVRRSFLVGALARLESPREFSSGCVADLSLEYPVATEIAKHGLWLPSSAFLKKADIRYVCKCIKEFYD